MNITFIGGGNMGCALIGGLLQKGISAAQMRVVEASPEARDKIQRQFGVCATAEMADAISGSDVVLLAVKPQQLFEVAKQLAPLLTGQLVISIAAGIRTADISRWLAGYQRLVRVMPNTPALVRAGISGLYALPRVEPAQKQQAETILAAVGATLWLEHEEQLDAITAVSGSGPAYVFYFIEALEEAALKLGFDAAQARRLSLETFKGSVKLAAESAEDPATLRARVTSKGGTTERAILSMENASVKQHIVNAVAAAAERSGKLGDELGKAG